MHHLRLRLTLEEPPMETFLPNSRTQGWGFKSLGVGAKLTDTVGMADKVKYLNCYKNQR